MAIDYKKELENAAKGMILIHEPTLLIEMVLRMLVHKIIITHASTLLYDKEKDTYILAASDGCLGLKIPVGLARIDKDDPLVYLFRNYKDRLSLKYPVLVYREAKKLLTKPRIDENLRLLLGQALAQMQTFDSQVCVPSYFQDELLGLLLLGEKKNSRSFTAEELNFLVAMASNFAMSIKNAQLFKDLQMELGNKHQLFLRIIIALTAAIEAKDYHTHGHITRVTTLSVDIAKRLSQANPSIFDKQFLEDLHIASLLHDIGKIGIPEHILNKKGILTNEEREKLKEHPLIGAKILQPIKELERPSLGVKYHHERYDGSGYPEGLKGEQIPEIASIINIADTFDALISDRPYRDRFSREDALLEMSSLREKQFNPKFLDIFFKMQADT